ncbi:MAG: IPT/TIG domain-containing protein, partial [Bacteroidetes bacterium]|nr:IPT/TIG domain-containing protein [Bacteroidota bacterium]
MFKNLHLRLPVLLLSGILLACQKDELTDPADYPQLRETSVVTHDKTGAIFRARLISPGNGEITDHGFVWWEKNIGDGPLKDLEAAPADMEKVTLGPLKVKASFEATADYGMAKGSGYFVKSFVTTSDGYTVYGTPTSFMSQGSPLPVVKSIHPETVVWGDTVTLTGAHFGYLTSTIQVGQTTHSEKWKVVTSTPTSIQCIVPRTVHENNSKLTVETVAGKTTSDINVKIDTSKPVITSISPATGTYGETMTIKGLNFRGDPAYWKVVFQNGSWGSMPVPVSDMTSTEIKVKIPEIDFKEASIRVVRSNQYQSVTSDPAPGLFTMSPPRIQSVAAVPGTNYTQVRISGSGFSRPTITFAGYTARIISYNQNEIIIDPIEGLFPRPMSSVQVEVTAAQQKDSYSIPFDYRASWIKRTPSQSFPFNSFQGPAATFSIGNTGYGIRQASYNEPWQLYKFNDLPYEWQRLNDPPIGRISNETTLSPMIINNTAYVI